MECKRTKKSRRRRNPGSSAFIDVALSDFADSKPLHKDGRVCHLRKALRGKPLQEWDSELISELSSEISDFSLIPSGEKTAPVAPQLPAPPPDNDGLVLSTEIWMLLAEYLRPEDVLTFSLICKTACRVVGTRHFWKRLYLRYYSPSIVVPTFLKPHCLERNEGLRARVVRSLYYTYKPYRDSLSTGKLSLDTLVGCTCDVMWIHRDEDKGSFEKRWVYCFRLSKNTDYNPARYQTAVKEGKNVIELNPDERSCLLEMVCDKYTDPKSVIGMKIRSATVDGRVAQLTFSSAPLSKHGSSYGAIKLYLPCVQPHAVYSWWHPRFCTKL